MIVHIDEVLDYVQCTMMHKFRYVDKVDATYTGLHSAFPKFNEWSLAEAFDKEFHKLLYHIFNYIQDGRYPSEYILRQKWGRLWLRDKTTQDIMFESTSEDGVSIKRKLEKKGLKAIGVIHPKLKKKHGIPFLVGKETEVSIGKHKIKVTLELVREIDWEGKKIIEIVDFHTGIKNKQGLHIKPHTLHIGHDLRVTAQSLAFRQLTGEVEDRISYYDVINDKEYYTSRKEKHYKALEKVLDNVEQMMELDIRYPVMNDRCFVCPFQINCNRTDWYE